MKRNEWEKKTKEKETSKWETVYFSFRKVNNALYAITLRVLQHPNIESILSKVLLKMTVNINSFLENIYLFPFFFL